MTTILFSYALSCLIFCGVADFDISKFTLRDGHKVNEFSQAASSAELVSISPNEVLELQSGIVYFGKSTCPQCVAIEPPLLECLTATRKSIYYFDTNTWREDSSFSLILDKFKVVGVPHVIYIEDNEFKEILRIKDIENLEGTRMEIRDFLFQYSPTEGGPAL